MRFQIVNPKMLGEPKGWNNGLIAPEGSRILFIAGQAGWEEDATGPPAAFDEQFARALDKVLLVLRESGGTPDDLARMTIYVTDLSAYRAAREAIGEAWRKRLGKHYPAVSLVAVSGLVDRGAVVEIEATAVLG